MNRFVVREEVENLVDVMTKDVNVPELLNQPGLEAGPSLIQWDGLKC